MIWLTRLAILFAGFIVAGVFFNLYYLAFCIVTIFALGIKNELILSIQSWICFVAGFGTAYYLMRGTWPSTKPVINQGGQPTLSGE